jgi:hypothetical protein
MIHIKCIHDLCSLLSHILVGLIDANFGLKELSLPKTDYKRDPPPVRSREGAAAEKHEIHNTDLQTTKIRGNALPEPLPIAPLPPSKPSPSAP